VAEIPDEASTASGLSAARPALIRTMNEQLMLEYIRTAGPYSRADLARVSGLSKPTVSLALANLNRVGLVRLAGQRTGLPGRSALLYEVRPEAGFVLGLDIGLRYLRGAVVDLVGGIRARASREVGNGGSGVRDRIGELVRLAEDLCARAGITLESVTQTVVGSPGVYDRRRDVISLTGGLPGLDGPEALACLREAFGSHVAIENDVDAAALAERALGHGRDVDNFAFVHIGTGIGMGLVLEGKLHRGVHGVAGEIAFMPLSDASAAEDGTARDGTARDGGAGDGAAAEPDSVDPREARRRGPLEIAAAADGIVRAARRAGMTGPVTARSVFEAAAGGNPRAAAVVDAEARLVAAAICCVITVADPSLVVLGGGIGQAPGFADAVASALAVMTPVMPDLKVSALGTDVVVDGCLAEGSALAWNQLIAAMP
jgi:predicted NBD/HSP70 family sugar kinase